MTLSRRQMMLTMAAAATCGVMPAKANATRILAGPAFGSSWRVILDDQADAVRVQAMVEAIIVDVDSTMSPYKKSSDLSRFNKAAAMGWQAMPQAVCAVTKSALNIAHQTNGAFDPTVGPTVKRYGFGPIEGGRADYRAIKVGEGAIRKPTLDLTLDLCGIAKGYALDEIAEALQMLGVESALIEVGGEVKALGKHPDDRAWQVAIEDPTSPNFSAQRIVAPGALALATSGHAANGLIAPNSFSHIINPDTNRPAKTSLASVSVLAATAMEADAFATALCAAGPEKAVALAERLGLSALFITDGADGPTEITTGHFTAHIVA